MNREPTIQAGETTGSSRDETLTCQIANTLRVLAIEAVQAANSGHPGLPLGAADLLTVLWTQVMRHNPAEPTWPDRDRFILSAGHGSALLYAALHTFGYPNTSLNDLRAFRQWGSRTPGHPEYEPERGIEMTTGPLGQGFSTGVGLALAERWLAERFNRPEFAVIDHFTYVLASDGDLMEGISHEAASLAGVLGLGRLIVLYDDNHISIDGPTELSYRDDVGQRFGAYGWHVQAIDGHDPAAIRAALEAAKGVSDRPSIVLCRTHIGYGSPRQDLSKAHGEPLGAEDLARTKQTLGWPADSSFFVPEEVKAALVDFRQAAAARSATWQAGFERWAQAHPELAQEWALWQRGELPDGWQSALPEFPAEKALATRQASGKVLDSLSPRLPLLIGGSADLTPSNNTRPQNAQDVAPGKLGGNYIHFGVREHGMGALMNGLALHGLRPYGGTFLVFSDYMRPAIRLAALMGLPVVYVFTHDSIGLGEDGPTHQPVEHLTALRAIPNLLVLRPADGRETAQAWRTALEHRSGPTALILTRQAVPQITPADNGLAQGGYVLAEGEGGLDLVLVASGSEVSLALEARSLLQAEGIAARLVSLPSWELFAAQPAEYRAQVLPPGVPSLAVEAGITLAWPRYAQAALGIDRYGASAPYKTLYEQFGLSPAQIAAAARRLLQSEKSVL